MSRLASFLACPRSVPPCLSHTRSVFSAVSRHCRALSTRSTQLKGHPEGKHVYTSAYIPSLSHTASPLLVNQSVPVTCPRTMSTANATPSEKVIQRVAGLLQCEKDSDLNDGLIALRRDLHEHPELSNVEYRTSATVQGVLRTLGVPFRTHKTGIIAEIPGVKNDQFIALRGDMDALPIVEETGLPFSSKAQGVMHACGHDGHTSIALGATALLWKQHRSGNPLPMAVRILFQPAEEVATGALQLIEEADAMKDVVYIFGGHMDRHYQTGQVIVHNGAVNASVDEFKIQVSGTGGHAARPHQASDAVLCGAMMVTSLQMIVSREVNPAHPCVVTVGKFIAGTAGNVISSHALLEGTIRSTDDATRQKAKASLSRIVQSSGELHTTNTTIEFKEGPPPVVNHEDAFRLAQTAAREVYGADHVLPLVVANMGGEDFAYYLQHARGCFMRFGGQTEGHGNVPAHSSKFDFDEGAMHLAARFLARVAVQAGDSVVAGEKEAPAGIL
eukprot:TRINITY_DN24540_c0_g1_i1.p1 TRINITY_DN24540_c0_g1~~TRINITY_DN24540_c0_g1_i1.p1  ORF type:complete len:502 (+),score=63.42 TRINITY_DN24540_c0_g1_i1:455-1960(+)